MSTLGLDRPGHGGCDEAAARADGDLADPMAAERAAVTALYAAREGTEWAA